MKIFQALFLFSLVGLGWATTAESAEELTLLSVMNVPMEKYGMSWQNVQVRLRVKNLGYEKNLRVIFTDTNGESPTQDATYQGPADDGFEVWEAWTNLRNDRRYTFRVEYAVAGQKFQLEGTDLRVGPMLYAGQNVQQVLSGRQIHESYANFVAAVRNLGFQKNVVVHYSCDSFQSEQTVALSFQPAFVYGYGYVTSPTTDGFEMWSGSINTIPANCGVIRYYYTYDVNGQHYADTNFGHHYFMSRS